MPINLLSVGGGTTTLTTASSASNFTVTLPAATTTMVGTDATQTLTAKTLTSPTLTTPNINSAQVATVTGTAPLYMARVWVKFSATTGSINGSGNVSSVSDNGTGNFTVNFTNAMPDTNYAWLGTCDPTSAQTSDGAVKVVFGRPDTNPTTGSIALLTCSSGAGRDDMESAFVAVFR